MPLSAADRRRANGANNRLRIGIIGCGLRGRTGLMEGIHAHAQSMNAEIVAVCDPWRVARDEATAMVREWQGREPRLCRSHRELLALNGIDAVMIASPDHLHALQLEEAARAGKHVYLEKPIAMNMDELRRAFDAVKEAGVVVQVGTQIRSLPEVVGAQRLYQSGALGRLSRINECRNAEKPYWYRYLKDNVDPKDVEWGEFLLNRPMRPFRADLYSAWQGYRDFSSGPIANLGCHFIDLVHFITGAEFPESCVCLGGTFTWKDEHGFTAPDCVQATWVYPEFLVTSSNNLGHGFGSVRDFYGEQGVLKMNNLQAPSYSAEGGPRRDGSIRGEHEVPPVERPDHFLDWMQCIRNGGTPHAPIEAGYQHAVAVIMAMISYDTGRKATYNPQQRTIHTTV